MDGGKSMYCKICGKKRNSEDRFCSFCGTPIEKYKVENPTLDDLQMIQETEMTYKKVNLLQSDHFDEEWEREERRERFTFMIFGIVIAVLIVVIVFFIFLMAQKENTNLSKDDIMIENNGINNNSTSNNGVGNIFSPGSSPNQELVVTPQLIEPNENTTEDSIEKTDHSERDEQIEQTEFMIYDSDVRYLVSADLNGLTAWEIRIARNEIYARHGRMFDSLELKAYFESKSWYVPEIPAVEFNISCLNEVELENLHFIINYEKAHNLN